MGFNPCRGINWKESGEHSELSARIWNAAKSLKISAIVKEKIFVLRKKTRLKFFCQPEEKAECRYLKSQRDWMPLIVHLRAGLIDEDSLAPILHPD